MYWKYKQYQMCLEDESGAKVWEVQIFRVSIHKGTCTTAESVSQEQEHQAEVEHLDELVRCAGQKKP